MNLLMAGMVPTVMALKARIPAAADPTSPRFWFVMSMGCWSASSSPIHELVAGGPPSQARHDDGASGGRRRAHDHTAHEHGAHAGMEDAPHMVMGGKTPWPPVPVMALLSFLALAAGVALAVLSRKI